MVILILLRASFFPKLLQIGPVLPTETSEMIRAFADVNDTQLLVARDARLTKMVSIVGW